MDLHLTDGDADQEAMTRFIVLAVIAIIAFFIVMYSVPQLSYDSLQAASPSPTHTHTLDVSRIIKPVYYDVR